MTLTAKFMEYPQLDGRTKKQLTRIGDGSVIFRFGTCSKCKGKGCEKCEKGVSMLPPQQPNDIVCPHFLEFKAVSGCPYDCSYCYLWRIPGLKKPRQKDWWKVRKHLLRFLQLDIKPELLNMGEVGEAGIGEPAKSELLYTTLHNNWANHRILYLTKGMNCNGLLELTICKNQNPQKHFVISYSINPQTVINSHERKTPTLKKRLGQVLSFVQQNFDVRLRVDPIMPISGWEKEYGDLFDTIFRDLGISPERITLGFPRAKKKDFSRPPEDNGWLMYIDRGHETGWGYKIPYQTRYEICCALIGYLETAFGYKNVSLCKEELQLWEELQLNFDYLDWKHPECNCQW